MAVQCAQYNFTSSKEFNMLGTSQFVTFNLARIASDCNEVGVCCSSISKQAVLCLGVLK